MKLITKIYLAFGSILLIFAFVTVSYVIQSDAVENNTDQALQSAELLRLAEGLEKAIVDAETGVRGFQVSDNEAFLTPYFVGKQTYASKQEELLKLVRKTHHGNDTDQLKRLDAIDTLFKKWQYTFAEPSNAKKRLALSSPPESAAAKDLKDFETNIIKKGVGKKITDQIRKVFAEFEEEEIKIRDKQIAELKTSSYYTYVLSIVLTVLSMAIGLVVVYMLAKAIRGRLNEMSEMANEVAQGHFNVQLTDSRNDEISQVSNSLNIMARRLDDNFTTLQKKNQELDQFAYVVSHDLKAPLRAINSLAEWIEEDLPDLDPDVQRNLTLMRGRVIRMENLINGILDYSRIGRKKLPVSTFSSLQLVDEISDSLAPGPHVTIHVSPDLPELKTERILLQQVFTNLIGNGIKYNDKSNPEITVSCRRLHDAYEFSVTDNGPGIPEEYHQKVFGIFQTMEARDTRESTGIGLAIVKKIIDEKGGSIWIESKVGEGSSFVFIWSDKNLQQDPILNPIAESITNR